MSNTTYAKKLLDPRWQRKRLEIMGRDDFACRDCGDRKSTLHVHHNYYTYGKEPWEYPDSALVTLCEPCHEKRHKKGQRQITKLPAYRIPEQSIDSDFIIKTLGFYAIFGAGEFADDEHEVCGQKFISDYVQVYRGPQISGSIERLVIHFYSWERAFLLKTDTPGYKKSNPECWSEPEWFCDEIMELRTRSEAIEAVRLHAK